MSGAELSDWHRDSFVEEIAVAKESLKNASSSITMLLLLP